MGRPKKIKETVDEVAIIGYVPTAFAVTEKKVIHPLIQEFMNGELNTLRDKINEIIKER